MTQGVGLKSGKGETCSPRSVPRTAPPIKKRGTSEPTWAAISRRVGVWKLLIQFAFEAEEGGGGVGRAGTHAALDREALVDFQVDFGGQTEGFEGEIDGFVRGISMCVSRKGLRDARDG